MILILYSISIDINTYTLTEVYRNDGGGVPSQNMGIPSQHDNSEHIPSLPALCIYGYCRRTVLEEAHQTIETTVGESYMSPVIWQ